MTPVNTDNIKKALDSFTDDEFVTAKEILRQEIRGATDSFLQDRLGLEKNIAPEEFEDPEEGEEE